MPSLRIGEHGLAEPARHHRQRQRALVEVLRCRQHARGDIATGDDRVLHTLHQHVDAFGSQATASGRIVRRVGRRQCPAEALAVFAFQHDAIDAYARVLLRRQAVALLLRVPLQADVGALFLLLAQHAFALLLPQQFLRGGITGLLGGRRPCGNGEHQRPTTMEPRPRVLLPCFHSTFHSKSSCQRPRCQPRCCRNVRLRHHGQPRHRATGAMPRYRSAGAEVSEGWISGGRA